MADDAGTSIPDTDNWSEWTFEQVLMAVTGEKVDLHTPANATWFNFNPSPGDGDQISYHAWGDYYYGVNVPVEAQTAWTDAVDLINEMMPDVARGKRGSMDIQTLNDLNTLLNAFALWSGQTSRGLTGWANNLDSDDSSFRGKAAFLIYWRLKMNGDGLDDTHSQLLYRHGRPISDSVSAAAVELGNFNTTMSTKWNLAFTLNLRDWIQNGIDSRISNIYDYIVDSGLQKNTPEYKLNAFNSDVDSGKAYIRRMLSSYPDGDLTSAGGWQKLSDDVSKTTVDLLKSMLDQPAQGAITTLAPAYVLATTSLIEITPPPPHTPPRPDTDNGNGPPDGDGNTNVPPPPDGGGDGNIPPPPDGGTGGGGDGLPPPDGGGGGDIPPPPDGGAGIGDGGIGDGGAGDGGVGDLGLDAPPGGGDAAGGGAGGGAGGFLPGLVPPGGADGGAGGGKGPGPGGDGAFEEPGGGDGVITPPDGGSGGGSGSLLPPGAGKSGTNLPAGGDGFGKDPGPGFGSGAGGVGAGAGAGGLGGADGLGGGLGGGGGFGGVGLGAGGATGAGAGMGGFSGAPSQLTGGSPGMNGAAGSSGGDGGVPFFPPMMGGGQGAGGEKPQERERQTWLSEDEEIWGTRVDIGSGVIGRMDEEEFEADEILLVGPARRQRRADTPRRPRPSEQETRQETGASGEESSGSASAT
jgi:hypothetical protein